MGYSIPSLVRFGQLLVLQSNYPWDTRPDEKDLFLKFLIREIRKFPYEILTFFLGKLYQKFFLFYNLITHGILDTEFG